MNIYWVVLIVVVGFVLGSRELYDRSLYRMGKYIKLKYPDRYEKQLTSSRPYITEFFKNKKQFSFPYNIPNLTAAGGWPGVKNTKKIIVIAEAENDQVLLKKAQSLLKIGSKLWIPQLILTLAGLLIVNWYSSLK